MVTINQFAVAEHAIYIKIFMHRFVSIIDWYNLIKSTEINPSRHLWHDQSASLKQYPAVTRVLSNSNVHVVMLQLTSNCQALNE